MTKHELLIIRQGMDHLQRLIMQARDFEGLSDNTVLWLGKTSGTIACALEQIDSDLEKGVPPRL